jgi:uncharacterized membrane protein YdjX (TVP38/TMEM64 family)
LNHEVTELVGNKKSRPITILVVSVLVIIILVFFLSKDMEKVKDFIRNSGYWGLVICIGLYGLLGATPIPSEPLTVLISTIYGPIQATIVAGLGNMTAAFLEYYLGANIGDVASFVERKEKLPWGLGKLPINSAIFLILGRMLPGYGPKFVSVLSGVYRVPILRYLWTSAIPTFIGAAIFAYGGFGASSLFKLIRP